MNAGDVYLAFDVGGTKVAAGLVSGLGEILADRRIPTSQLRAGGDPLDVLLTLGDSLLAEAGARPTAVGISLPGPTEPEPIRMLAAPTIPEFLGVALAPVLRQRFDCPAAGDNDGNACALAEWRLGAGRGWRDVVYVTISTGIGGGAVLAGEVFRGSTGTSLEIGHQIIEFRNGPQCDCGAFGCLEALASGRGIARRAARAGLPPDAATAEGVLRLMEQGNELAVTVWEETIDFLAAGLSNVFNLLDPGVVVLGGGVSAGAGERLIRPLTAAIRTRCMPSLARQVRVVPAAFGGDSSLVGAACLAMSAVPPTVTPAGLVNLAR